MLGIGSIFEEAEGEDGVKLHVLSDFWNCKGTFGNTRKIRKIFILA
jgi:hypothetical protein